MSAPKNIDINYTAVKNKIIEYLNSRVDMDNKPVQLMSEQQVNYMKGQDYVMCPKYKGSRTWILFFKDKHNYYSVSFPIHSHHKSLNLNVQIFPLDILISETMYAGTIMEGTYFKISGVKYFVIDEIHLLCGEKQHLKNREYKLKYASDIFKDNIIQNPYFFLTVAAVFKDTQEDIIKLYDKIKHNANIEGIIFYPRIIKDKIFVYTVLQEDKEDDIVHYNVFKMVTGKKSDVYFLLDGTKKVLAHIPNVEVSKKCKKWFSNRIKEVNVRCRSSSDGWIPLELC